MSYPQPAAYRDEIDGVDCQTQALGVAYPQQWGAERQLASPSSDGTDPHAHEDEEFSLADLPDLEFCDGEDNDSDGEIDESCLDGDGDGTVDAVDNCPATPNPQQTDLDFDHLGDVCQYPEVSGLSATGSLTVLLSWAVSTPDVAGFNIYRMAIGETEPRLINSNYPTTTDLFFEDTELPVSTGGILYWVAPINLLGVEGVPATIGTNELFSDGFE